ncbi:PQQ-binding-like beta-propeller repeat protein, partial [Candidatus Sumerlaeota bacterium]|nr:PQQ-binding-like beta-propeller repeat protein [Candidatus Sumerlaeota bacterium]
MQRSIYLICLAGLALLFSSKVAAEDVGGEMGNWPQWRGPDGSGMARSDGPLRWSDTENIKWRTEIPGKGHSTPVIWGDKIFITTAVPTGKPAQAAPAAPSARGRRGGSFHGGGGPQVEHSFDLLCIDKGSGNILWQKSSSVATPHEGHHGTYGSFASNSAVTDGSRVYAFYGSRGIYCYELDGPLDWHV